MAINKEEIIEALSYVRHPQQGNDIISLNFVQNIEIHEKQIKFTLHFPTVNDPLKNSVKKAAERAIAAKFGDEIKTDISITTAVKIKSEAEPKILPEVKNIIAIASGKGGVGKSTVAVNMAVAFAQKGYKTGLIDADIFGPSVPKMFHVEDERPYAIKKNGKDMIIPIERHGVKMLSIGFFVSAEDATIWRGPMASNALKQLMTDADWGALDYLFVDLPPGTSDIHLTLVQTVGVTGSLIVSTPQDVALADALKGINMFRSNNINVPVLGMVENMSWFTPAELPNNKYYIFGNGGGKNLAEKLNVPLLGQIPLIQSIREGGDAGEPPVVKYQQVKQAFSDMATKTIEIIEQRNKTQEPTSKVNITHR